MGARTAPKILKYLSPRRPHTRYLEYPSTPTSAILQPCHSWEGEKDFLKPFGEDLLGSFVDPVVIKHPRAHTVPRLDEEGLRTMSSFLDKVEENVCMNVDYAVETEKSREQSETSQFEEVLIDASSF